MIEGNSRDSLFPELLFDRRGDGSRTVIIYVDLEYIERLGFSVRLVHCVPVCCLVFKLFLITEACAVNGLLKGHFIIIVLPGHDAFLQGVHQRMLRLIRQRGTV